MSHLVDTAISLTLAVGHAVTSALVQCVWRVVFRCRTQILPKLYFKECALNKHLLENCSALSRVYVPPWWMENHHAQTIIPTFLPKPNVVFKREMVDLEDGGVLALDWAQTGTDTLTTDSPVMFILPGLAGDMHGYKHLALCAADKGLRPVVFNKRGHGGCRIKTPKLQSFGDPADFKFVVNYVERKFPNASLTAVGVSAGSGLLASYLGEEREATPLVANVGISPGYDASKLFNEYLRPPYDYLLLQGLRRIITENKLVLSAKFDISHILQATTVAEIEERLYCKIYGYRTVEEYWKANNPMRDITEVKKPMLCISACDDPVCPEGLIPFSLFTQYENVMLAAMDRGGHCGFIEEGTLTNWAEKTAVDYLLSVLEFETLKANEVAAKRQA